MSEVRFAIVGAGFIGNWHATVIDEAPDATLVAIIDQVPALAEELGLKHGVPSFSSLEQASRAVDFEAVAVCTPSGQHERVAVRALELGKHVLIEKPIDVSLKAADSIADAQRKSGKVVTVISQHRFDPGFEAAQRLVESGSFGTLTSASAAIAWYRDDEYFESADWRGTWELDGGGAFMNQGVHTVDLLLSLLGPASEVAGFTATLAHEGIEVEDTGVAIVRFKSGAVATILATTTAYPDLGTRIQVHGTRGSATLENDQLTFVHTADEESAIGEVADRANQSQLMPTVQVHNEFAKKSKSGDTRVMSDSHHEQYADFISAINGHGAVRVDVLGARAAIELIVAIYESQRSGRIVPLS